MIMKITNDDNDDNDNDDDDEDDDDDDDDNEWWWWWWMMMMTMTMHNSHEPVEWDLSLSHLKRDSGGDAASGRRSVDLSEGTIGYSKNKSTNQRASQRACRN